MGFAVMTYFMCDLRINVSTWIFIHILTLHMGSALVLACAALTASAEAADFLIVTTLTLSALSTKPFLNAPQRWLETLQAASIHNKLFDIYADGEPAIGSDEELIDSDDAHYALLNLFVILVLCRLATYLSLKFLYTGLRF